MGSVASPPWRVWLAAAEAGHPVAVTSLAEPLWQRLPHQEKPNCLSVHDQTNRPPPTPNTHTHACTLALTHTLTLTPVTSATMCSVHPKTIKMILKKPFLGCDMESGLEGAIRNAGTPVEGRCHNPGGRKWRPALQ